MIEGMDQCRRKLKAMEEGQAEVMEPAVMAGLLVGERYTKEAAPVKYGNLRESYTSVIESSSDEEVIGSCGSNVEYAPFQELGTSRMKGTPHLRPGFLNHQAEIKKAVESKLAEKLRGL